MDSEGLLQCPYDKNHMIRPCRFPYHLVKCRENNPSVAKVTATCPYNARHRVPKKELQLHMSTCENRVSLDNLPVMMQPEDASSAWQSPPCEENWEEEEPSESKTPFVLNGFGNVQPYDKSENNSRPEGVRSYRPQRRFK